MLSWYQSTNFSSLPTLLFLLSMTTTIINTNDHHSTLITINVAAQTPVKLTSTNYLAWKLQFQTLFIGYDLHGFIDGSHPCPASLLPDTTTPNPAYTLWIRQDQLLLNAILGSLSPAIMSFIAQAQTSKEAWTILANTYAKPSRGRIKQVKNQLKHITKGSMGVSEFLQTIKARADELATLGALVDAEDLSDRILEGLGDDYKELTRAVQARDNPISFDELHENLLNFEASLQHVSHPDQSYFPASAHLANCHSTSYRQSSPSLHSAWHHRLGHPALSILQHVISKHGLDLSSSSLSKLSCDACHCNKSHKLSFSTSTITSTRPLYIIFSDVWTSPIISYDGFKYYVLFVDHFTKYIWLYPLKQKSHVNDIFIQFKAITEKHFNQNIQTLYSDNGGEYVALTNLLALHGISHHTTPPHTPEHNGFSERRHLHIVETSLTLLSHASIPLCHWPHAFATTVYLINRMPTPTLNLSSPYEQIFASPPNYSKLKVFGCLCYPWLRPYTHHKLEPRSKPCVFFGYSLTQSVHIQTFCIKTCSFH